MLAKEIPMQKWAGMLEQHEAISLSAYYEYMPPEIAEWLGIRRFDIGGAQTIVAAGIDVLAFNRVVGLGIEQSATEQQIDEIIAIYNDAGANRFFVQVSPYAKPEWLPEILVGKGFCHYNNWVKLYREIAALPRAETDLRIKMIHQEQAALFAEMIVTCFQWPDALKPMLALPVGLPGWRHYLAYDGMKPVACAACYINGEFASLAFAATLPEYRGRGAQSALIARRFRDAAEAGCLWMMTETAEETPKRSVPSFRNMLRHGFEVAYLRPNYLWQNNVSTG